MAIVTTAKLGQKTSEPKAILHVIHGLTTGGAEVDLLNKCIYLIEHYDYRMTICCLMRRGDLAQRFEEQHIGVIGPLMGHRYDMLAASKLRRLLVDPTWDLVHSHLCAANLITWATNQTIMPNHRIPQVAGEHAMAERWPFWVHQADRWMVRSGVKLLVPSQVMAQSYIGLGLPEQAVTVVPNGIDPIQFNHNERQARRSAIRRAVGIDEDQFVIGTICRLAAVKNLPLLFNAIDMLVSQSPSVRLLVVGDGPERSMLEEYIGARGWQTHIQLLGNRTDVADLLTAFDLFVLSSNSESFGIAVAEALLMNVPIVATAVGGIPELTGQGKYAKLVPPNDAQALVAALQWMIDHRDAAQQMASDGGQYIQSKLTIDHCAEQLHQQYVSRGY